MTLRWRLAAILGVVGLALAGCSKSDNAQARGRDEAKPVVVDSVRQEQVHRAVEVVGTLAADDDVTVSSEAEGSVSRILADLGDRVRAGQALIELDHEKLQYSNDQQRAALARALAQYGAPDTTHLPPIEQTPDVQKAKAELVQAQQAYERADELHKRQLVPRQALDDANATLLSKKASYESSLQNAKNLKANIDASDAAAKLADRQLRDAVIRAPFDGYVAKRLVSLGEYVKVQTPVMARRPDRPVEGHGGDSREDGSVDRHRAGGRAPRGRVSGQGRSPARSRASARRSTRRRGRFRSKRWCPITKGC